MGKIPSKYEFASVEMSNGKWNSVQSTQMIMNRNEWGVERLSLHDNQRAQILKDISHVTFTKLTVLLVWGNKIECVEVLGKIFMPYVKVIHLDKNNIRCLGVMSKVQCPDLIQVGFRRNYICEQRPLTQSYFPKLQFFWPTTSYNDEKPKDAFFNYFFLAKLQTNSLSLLWMKSCGFQMKRSIHRSLNRKWKDIIID